MQFGCHRDVRNEVDQQSIVRHVSVLSCDWIMVMDQGRIVEQGTHASLVAAGGLYARLARLQFEGV